jgi:hypothetical protein
MEWAYTGPKRRLKCPGQVEIIDLRTLFPLDEEAVFNDSVSKHGKALVLSEEQQNNSFAEALSHRISHQCFHFLDARVEVMGALTCPQCPSICAGSGHAAHTGQTKGADSQTFSLLRVFPFTQTSYICSPLAQNRPFNHGEVAQLVRAQDS